MATYSIKDKNIYRIEDKVTNGTFYGSNQEWYLKSWQRMAGCGPSTVANILYYIERNSKASDDYPAFTREECLERMNEVWKYVTPSFGGVSSTAMLSKGVDKYLARKEFNLRLDSLDIPKKKAERPDSDRVLSFISKALEQDSPVAFLNLEHGAISILESWHWVTIIALDYENGKSSATVEIMDNGELKRFDLILWLQTTKLGGGFVSFEPSL